MKKSSKKSSINPSKPDNRSNYCITDFFNNYDEVSSKIRTVENILEKDKTQMVTSLVYYSNSRSWIYCIISACLTALACFLVEFLSGWIFNQRRKNIMEDRYFASLIVWVVSALILATIATGLCHIFGAEAHGAGVPELKCILTGARMSEFLEFRTLIAKFFGLIAALGGGFWVGRIGPNIHIGAMIFSEVAKIGYFKEIRKDSVLKNQGLMIGGAVGISCGFGTPFAGFKIYLYFVTMKYLGLVAAVELVGKISSIRTMWILYVSLFFATCTFRLLGMTGLTPMIHPLNHLWVTPFEELLQFAVLGICCGLYSALFIKILIKFQVYRAKVTAPAFFRTRYSYTWVVIIILALMEFHIDFLRFGDKIVMNDIFGHDILDKRWFLDQSMNAIWAVLALLLLKTFMFFLGITSPIPAGVFGPFVLMGALVGRVYGEFMREFFGVTEIGKFAVAGAAALSAMSTRFLAMTILIVEITEDVNIVFLIMIAVLFAYGTGNLFTKSFFYSTIEMKKMPYVSKLMKDQIYKMKAKDIVQNPKVYLHSNSTYNDIFIYITTAENICIADYIPVVLDEKDYTLFGIVKTENLIKYFRNELKANTNINHKSPWVGKLEILMSIYTFLDEEAITHAKKICERAKKVMMKMKTKNIYRKQNFNFLDKSPKAEHELIEMTSPKPKPEDLREELIPSEKITIQSEEEKKQFFARKMDFSDPILNLDRSPAIVTPSTNLCKVHYLFVALGVSTIFVVEKGVLKGVIKRNYFLGLNANKVYPS